MLDLESIDLSRLEAVISTDKGEMTVGFFADKAPRHVRNFAELAQQDFYNGLAFHRVIRNFMVQGGCPNTREDSAGVPGTGGPGHHIDAEFNDVEHRRGVLSMARSQDPNSAGSQFFIVHADHVAQLDGSYTAFGEIRDGLEVLDAIATVECEFGPGGERSVPTERVEIQSVTMREAEQVEEAAAEESQPEQSEPEQSQPEESSKQDEAESAGDDAPQAELEAEAEAGEAES